VKFEGSGLLWLVRRALLLSVIVMKVNEQVRFRVVFVVLMKPIGIDHIVKRLGHTATRRTYFTSTVLLLECLYYH
jgi:hypothetical protein